MKTHFRHQVTAGSELVMLEQNSNSFDVTYLTLENDGDGKEAWYSNNTQNFKSFSDAAKCYNTRRASANPFKPTVSEGFWG